MLEQTQLFDPKEAIWWSNLRHKMKVIIGQLRRLMLVSLKAAKLVLVQLVILCDKDLLGLQSEQLLVLMYAQVLRGVPMSPRCIQCGNYALPTIAFHTTPIQSPLEDA